MDNNAAIDALTALAQRKRRDVLRFSARHGADSIAAGEIARQSDVPQNTNSAHFSGLARAGLIRAESLYRADLGGRRALTLLRVKDCWAGNAGRRPYPFC